MTHALQRICYKTFGFTEKDQSVAIHNRPVARGGSVGADEPPSEIKGPLF